ncbi:ParB/RepB/Spo0J family partition protein [Roseateles sp. DC23W]|uniref:ParB/RepB/Spo0J family partition protein n=1 Tax=Pelomonas dachongensis TaxID=3299029 RepID=A0ABW7EKC8_9BURK
MSQPTTAAAYDAEPARHLPLGIVKPSPTNPRKRFDPVKIKELSESIAKHGVMQPILVRPNPEFVEGNGQPPFEIVAGERRWRASQLAEATHILALVRNLNNAEALELQLLENLEREDLHPLEESDGLQALMDELHVSADDLALKIGKSKRWLDFRLALRNLCDEARDAMLAGTLTTSIANFIATMPDKGEQRRATERILIGFNGEPFTVRAAQDYLRKEFMLELANARFDIAALYTAAGPCHQCTKRTGAAPDLFGDAKAGDMCQDSKCFAAKTGEAHDLLLQACRDAGHRIVQGEDARKLLSGQVKLDSGHYAANEPCSELTSDKRQLFDIFGSVQKGFVTIEHPATQALVTWVPAKIVKKALKAKGLLRPPAPAPKPAQANSPAAAPPPQAEASAPAPAFEGPPDFIGDPLTPDELHGRITVRTGQLFSRTLFANLCKLLAEAEHPPLAILLLLVTDTLLTASAEAMKLVREQAPDLPELRSSDNASVRRWNVKRHLAKLNGRQLADLLAMLLVAEELSNDDQLDDLEAYSNFAVALAADLCVSTDELQAQAEAQAAEQIQAEEDNRLGRNAAGEAFAAAQAREAP